MEGELITSGAPLRSVSDIPVRDPGEPTNHHAFYWIAVGPGGKDNSQNPHSERLIPRGSSHREPDLHTDRAENDRDLMIVSDPFSDLHWQCPTVGADASLAATLLSTARAAAGLLQIVLAELNFRLRLRPTGASCPHHY
jgi:hypothetical protein